ncbi:hypothetical protein [Escherichia coli]|uniref:hypothetical protein n=1 Tax=Escherichia coli TaxID=562 RepID=UPI0015CC2E0F|nr:hypothetical protein [Escherichia coli]
MHAILLFVLLVVLRDLLPSLTRLSGDFEASLATPATRQGIQLIPALTRVPAYIDTAVDSDNAVSM